MSEKKQLFIVSHTHWDREWYQTFQGYRKRLVTMMDELISHMEKDPQYKFFHLDGQTIMIKDYLEIRPENKNRLASLIKEGRIIVGPWYVMPDEFLVSGESLVRNIQLGFEIAKSFQAKPLSCGYVVDIFGHNSQMPQIWKGFGIESTILYRGIGDYPKDLFNWIGADGSKILGMKIDGDRSYGNFYFGVRSPFNGRAYEKEELYKRLEDLVEYSSSYAVSDNLLMLDGVDHMEIEPELSKLIGWINGKSDKWEAHHTTLEKYISAQKIHSSKLENVKGELYQPGKRGLNNILLKNVLSSIVPIKQSNDFCEMSLTRWAEPFDSAASFLSPQNTAGFFKHAWQILLENHPHDSICGCSITRVHEDMQFRFNQVKDISQEIQKISFQTIADSLSASEDPESSQLLIFNGGQQPYQGVIEADLEFKAGFEGSFKLFNPENKEVPYQILGSQKKVVKGVFEYRRLPEFPEKDLYKIAFTASIPPLGYTSFSYKKFENIMPGIHDYSFKKYYPPVRYLGNMQTSINTWENQFLVISFNNNGLLSILDKENSRQFSNLLVFEDGGDQGDGWNYKPPLQDSKYLSTGMNTQIAIVQNGPEIAQIKITQVMNIPTDILTNGTARTEEKAPMIIDTFVTLQRGSRKINFKTLIQNHSICHRLRVLFPTFLEMDHFFTSTPFYLQKRSFKRIDTSDYLEFETGVVPNQGVIVIQDKKSSLGIYNKGLYETEAIDDKSRTIALTLFRSFKREVGRGEEGEIGKLLGEITCEYAIEIAKGEKSPGALMVSGQDWRTGITAFNTQPGKGSLNRSGSFLNIEFEGVVLSSFRKREGGLYVIRLYNSTDTVQKGKLTLYKEIKEATVLNLNDEPTNPLPFKGREILCEFKPAEIRSFGILIGK